MSRTRYVSLIGLGFGDCGKGLFTDYLARTLNAHTVVRFNGGAQAGHNVVLPDGRHHTFSQFGAGSFVDGVRTLLAAPIVVHPSALLFEAQALEKAGVRNALDRILIDARCRVTTPFHQAAGRLREHVRGADAHGTCGVGVGETVRHAIAHPDDCLRFGDLHGASRQRVAHEKLINIQHTLRHEIAALLAHPIPDDHALVHEWNLLCDDLIIERWLEQIQPVLQRVAAQPIDTLSKILHQPGTVVFEGAQGALLDEWRGFHPHTTWSSVSTHAVNDVLRDYGIATKAEHYGVLRSYLTRHGTGPFPTHDGALYALTEPHNSDANWQGAFRRGHPDAVLLRYALACVGALDGLAISHLDVFDRIGRLRWCDAYDAYDVSSTDESKSAQKIHQLNVSAQHDLTHQSQLTELLMRSTPCYDDEPIKNATDLLERFTHAANLPSCFSSSGNTHLQVNALIAP